MKQQILNWLVWLYCGNFDMVLTQPAKDTKYNRHNEMLQLCM